MLDGFAEAVDYFPDVTYNHFLNWFMGEAKEQEKGDVGVSKCERIIFC